MRILRIDQFRPNLVDILKSKVCCFDHMVLS